MSQNSREPSEHEEYEDEYDEEYDNEGEAEGDEEAAQEEAGEGGDNSLKGIYNSVDVNDQIFEELHLADPVVKDVMNVWDAFLRTGATRDAAGEVLYSAVFEAAPSLQSLFKTPRAVMAMRFINGLNQIVASLHDPPSMKITVETLGFQHLDLEVTVPRTVIFRDAITDLLAVELGSMVTTRARDGMSTLLNYVGGAYIYIRMKFTERLKILNSSWATANNRRLDENGEEAAETMEAKEEKEEQKKEEQKKEEDSKKGKGKLGGRFGGRDKGEGNRQEREESGSSEKEASTFRSTSVPTTFNEMFMFNAAVMGFGDKMWMNEVLFSFDAIVRNVSNSGRLQEECDVLGLRIAKFSKAAINLTEYKAVMLASLRSLVPKDWNSAHENAWSWLWENVERMIKANLGKPALQERALSKFLSGLDEKTRGSIRRDVYSSFFSLAPAGQDYFKQSTTRLHYIADKIVAMTLEMYKDANKMVQDISALGLRHVGYGIPTELFGPFVTACVQVMRTFTEDDTAQEAFRWSLGLVARILTRVITEGSTIVMKAINQNSSKTLRKAIACAPRGKRALWMLNIQVGTQSISPLIWAIETGSLEAARAIIVDLLTIRADRDHYYYGMDSMFERHPDIVKRLAQDAPALLPTLFDGLIWRSRTTENGMRRVNYYIRHLIMDKDGGFAKSVEWIIDNGDPKIVCHPVIAMVTDIVWSRVAFRAFLYGKMWVIFTLVVFIFGIAALPDDSDSMGERAVIMACRLFTYLFSMAPRVYMHVKYMCRNFRNREIFQFYHVPLPNYLEKWQDVVDLALTLALVLMLGFEPIVFCLQRHEGDFEGAGLFTEACPEAGQYRFTYSVMSLLAMFLFFTMTIDLSVFSTRVSAFVLICFRVMSEVWLYVLAMAFAILTFSCATASLRHSNGHFSTIRGSALSFMEIATFMFDPEQYMALPEEPALLITVTMYVVVSIIFLLNLLIAQMNCAYTGVYDDMVGYARLNRGKVVTESMQSVQKWRWERFVNSLKLSEPCEFGEGDIGLTGAIQVLEPASQNITTVDMIRRFGGSTSPAAQWPEEEELGDNENDRFSNMEKLLEKVLKRSSAKGGGKKGPTSSGQAASSMEHSTESKGEEVASDAASEAGN